MPPLRWISRVEKLDGSESIVFPTNRYEWETSQSVYQSSEALVGASYAYDVLKEGAGVKANAVERIRFLVLGNGDEIDQFNDRLRALVYWGRVKIWTTSANGNRWAYARLAEMPNLSFTVDNRNYQPIILVFERFSDWYGESLVSANVAITSSPQIVVINNPGNAPVRNAILIFKGVFTNPAAVNNSALVLGSGAPYEVASNRDGAAGTDWLKIDSGANTAEFSSNSGLTYIDDYSNFVREVEQVGLWLFEPGNNSVEVYGTNGGTFYYEFYGAWH